MQHTHQGHRSRLRQRFIDEGLDSFQPHEILELLLTYAIPRSDVNPLAHELIRTFGSLSNVLDATPEELMQVPGMGQNSAALLALMPHLTGRYLRSRIGERPMLTSYRSAGEYCKTLFLGEPMEVLYLIALDASGRVLRSHTLARGTLDETPLYPRHVVEAALRFNAHSVLLAHNHPAGTLRASPADMRSTELVVKALDPIGVIVKDHIIVADDEFISMRKMGMLNEELAPYGLQEIAAEYVCED